MKIVFQKDVINEAVGPLMSGVSTKMTLASTTGILIEASLPGTCVLTTFDLEKGVRLRIEADVIEPGSAIVNATRFSQIVRVMEGGDITMTVDDRMGVSIVSGRAAHTMTALRASDFPRDPHHRSDGRRDGHGCARKRCRNAPQDPAHAYVQVHVCHGCERPAPRAQRSVFLP